MKLTTKICVALLLALVVAGSTGGTARATTSGTVNLHALRGVAWQGGRYETAAGATVNVVVSPVYAADTGMGQRWADFFASLVHGPELSLLHAYIAPLEEVQQICGASDVVGCYQADRLVTIGEPAFGISPQAVAAHEYGHHVAYHRVNPPWVAVNWGTKRWSTYENICARTAGGTAFPGDEGLQYSLNPAEAFAESYRVLNGYMTDDWSIVDPSFRPDVTALSLLREDVVDPWQPQPARTMTGRITRTGTTIKLTTPLDGELNVTLRPGGDEITLLSGDGKTQLAQGAWSTNGSKALDYRICGQRTVLLRVTRHTAARRFTLRLTSP